jgi:hypothetical protein
MREHFFGGALYATVTGDEYNISIYVWRIQEMKAILDIGVNFQRSVFSLLAEPSCLANNDSFQRRSYAKYF